jgi:hypothetical protein
VVEFLVSPINELTNKDWRHYARSCMDRVIRKVYVQSTMPKMKPGNCEALFISEGNDWDRWRKDNPIDITEGFHKFVFSNEAKVVCIDSPSRLEWFTKHYALPCYRNQSLIMWQDVIDDTGACGIYISSKIVRTYRHKYTWVYSLDVGTLALWNTKLITGLSVSHCSNEQPNNV